MTPQQRAQLAERLFSTVGFAVALIVATVGILLVVLALLGITAWWSGR